ncbi:unnamed protein product [Urochloa decumbens]|uniref:RING-type E3 ubiquitin transferase n=1 Tax=Urochloa decumbens TaxID=240449 RepID=A0ABC9CMU2_9POAL
MLNPPLRRRPPPSPRADEGFLACYGIVVATASMLLFTILAATVYIVKACALAGASAAAFGAAGCVSRWWAAGGAAPALPTTVAPAPTARARAACGMVGAAIDALPAFAYARPGGDGSKSERCALCPVCLEDVEAGEMVRRLPECGQLFHVKCIDMWLHSHATCPLCRCQVSPPQQAVAKLMAAADPPDDALPPV